jgi:hypothetical protein
VLCREEQIASGPSNLLLVVTIHLADQAGRPAGG